MVVGSSSAVATTLTPQAFIKSTHARHVQVLLHKIYESHEASGRWVAQLRKATGHSN